MLCDYVAVADGKLFISGAGISVVATRRTGPPFQVNLALALLVRVPWTATNEPHRLTVDLLFDDPAGMRRVPLNDSLPAGVEDEQRRGQIVAEFTAGRPANMAPGDMSLLPAPIPMHGLVLPQLGHYFFSISIDDVEAERLSFRLAQVAELGGASPIFAP